MRSIVTVSAGLLAALAFAAPVFAEVPGELQGAWLAEDISGGGVVDRVQTRIEITEKGEVFGSGGCNRVKGMAEVDGPGIGFGRMASTMMACPPAVMDQEQKFLKALEDVKSWKVDTARGKLLLLDGGGKTLVVLARD